MSELDKEEKIIKYIEESERYPYFCLTDDSDWDKILIDKELNDILKAIGTLEFLRQNILGFLYDEINENEGKSYPILQKRHQIYINFLMKRKEDIIKISKEWKQLTDEVKEHSNKDHKGSE